MCDKCVDKHLAEYERRDVNDAHFEVYEVATGKLVGHGYLFPPNWQFPDDPSRWSSHHTDDAHTDSGLRYATAEDSMRAIIKKDVSYKGYGNWDQDAWEERQRRSMNIYD